MDDVMMDISTPKVEEVAAALEAFCAESNDPGAFVMCGAESLRTVAKALRALIKERDELLLDLTLAKYEMIEQDELDSIIV